ncbi:hypothetical protein [Maricaulis sp.]|uniref:hypothetical protein n=1 Tax=Maricaulis sp. TaxID=1486257 RepID=UPI00260D5770|nr:hypothetical protein [Maricaulis sp.]
MLSQLEFCLEDRLCIWRVSGTATVKEICDGYAERFNHPEWTPVLESLTVINKLALGGFTPQAAGEIMQFIRDCDLKHKRAAKRSALVCSDELSRALLAYWEHRAKNELERSERAFATEAEARAWLVGAREADEKSACA